MARKRSDAMCGILDKGENKFVVTIGGFPVNVADQCEYLQIYPNNTLSPWKTCSNLDLVLVDGQMLTDPESGDLILLGGNNPKSSPFQQDSIYRLSNIDGSWILQNQKLRDERSAHASIFVNNPSPHPDLGEKGRKRRIRSEL